ncbi:CcmD family protein [Texcoconibacillus texcoconensis]|uniref:CcmD family protein n=1 Tax=Texcoconibacillus texcoconensis TaxID=1095777 RepID=A0A840QTE1_9BACI|nr:CcmD family protein [Texcoconibacillus texcoconensis]MBB5174806.1 CcmD family protein [Texcoconibacillus texcoconensis]
MSYLFAAYTIIWLLIASYVFVLGKRQKAAAKELSFMKEMLDD